VLQTTDHTPFVTALAVFPDQEGEDTVFSITKGGIEKSHAQYFSW